MTSKPPGEVPRADYVLGGEDMDNYVNSYLLQLQSGNLPGFNHVGAVGQGDGAAQTWLPQLHHAAPSGTAAGNVVDVSLAQGYPIRPAAGQSNGSGTSNRGARQSETSLMGSQQEVGDAVKPSKSNRRSRPADAVGVSARKQVKRGAEDSDSSSDEDGSFETGDKDRQRSSGQEGDKKHPSLQEKNRRAQRRFRERQKGKLHDLQHEIEDLTARVGALQSENGQLHSRTGILEKVLDMRNEQIQAMHESEEALHLPADMDLASLQRLTRGAIQLTAETIQDLTVEQIQQVYVLYIQEMARCLDEIPIDSTEDEHQELEGLVKDLSLLIMRLGVIKPLVMRKFVVMSRQGLNGTESDLAKSWEEILGSVQLQDSQKQSMIALKKMFLQRIGPIMDERKQLNIQIQSNLPHDTFHTKNALTYIKAHEAVIKLRDNLQAEQHTVMELSMSIFKGVMTNLQMAKLFAKIHPAVPDALGLSSTLALMLGEPGASESWELAMQLGGYAGVGVASSERSNDIPAWALQNGPSAQAPPSSSILPLRDTSSPMGAALLEHQLCLQTHANQHANQQANQLQVMPNSIQGPSSIQSPSLEAHSPGLYPGHTAFQPHQSTLGHIPGGPTQLQLLQSMQPGRSLPANYYAGGGGAIQGGLSPLVSASDANPQLALGGNFGMLPIQGGQWPPQ